MNGKTLTSRLLLLAAMSIRASRPACSLLQGENSYLRKTLSVMKKDGLILISTSKPWCMRLSRKGVDYLAEHAPAYSDFYLLYSNNHMPGGTQAHVQTQLRTSEALSICGKCGVKIGPEKPALSELTGEKKLNRDDAVLYLTKELKFGEEQKVSRAKTSRASAVLFSHGIDGLVYSVCGEDLGLNPAAESAVNLLAFTVRNSIYAEMSPRKPGRSIVLGLDYDLAERMLAKPEGGKDRKRRTIADAIRDRTLTKTDFLLVPMTEAGVTQMRLLTMLTPEELSGVLFTEEEREAGRVAGCQAISNGLRCFEMITMNLTLLHQVLSQLKELLRTVCAV